MRNNINGDFSIVEKISELKPGAFININWNKKKLMLPYSLRKDYISFTDKKWDWRYQLNEDGSPDINNPSLYEEVDDALGRIVIPHYTYDMLRQNLVTILSTSVY